MTTKIWRGFAKLCARCGERKLFHNWVTMVERCPRCGLRFERGQGFWLGSIMINSAFTFGLFLLVFVGGMVATWPDTPWTALSVGTLLLNAIFPVAFHPFSRRFGWGSRWHSIRSSPVRRSRRLPMGRAGGMCPRWHNTIHGTNSYRAAVSQGMKRALPFIGGVALVALTFWAFAPRTDTSDVEPGIRVGSNEAYNPVTAGEPLPDGFRQLLARDA